MATADTHISTPFVASVAIGASAPGGRVRFSREAYHRMFEIGVLHGEQRFELLDGDVYMMMSPIGPSQSNVTSRLTELFVGSLPRELQCRTQQPIVINDQSEPEPDVAIVRRRDAEYSSHHPGPTDVVLLIEVAQSSLSVDLGLKSQIYAEAGIFEYWVVDLINRKLITHRDPTPTGYRTVASCTAESTVAPVGAPECRIDLGRLLR
jgi:Uma2 family endonuclease